jgi:hypothetical protein
MKKDKNKIFWESLSFEYHLATLLTVFQSTRAVVLKPGVATHVLPKNSYWKLLNKCDRFIDSYLELG